MISFRVTKNELKISQKIQNDNKPAMVDSVVGTTAALMHSSFSLYHGDEESALERLSLVRTRPSTVMAEEFCSSPDLSWRSLPNRLDTLVQRLHSWVRNVSCTSLGAQFVVLDVFVS
jgi:hypothetical protein